MAAGYRSRAFLICVWSNFAAAQQDIWLTSIQPFTGADWDGGISMRIGAQIMLEQVNANPALLNGYELKVAWQDGMCAKTVGTNLFLQNLFDKTYTVFAPGASLGSLDVDGDGTIETSDTQPLEQTWTSTQVSPEPIGLLGSGCAGTALNIAYTAYKARFPMISNSATRPGLSDRSTYPNFYRTIMPDTFFNDAWIAMAKMLGQTQVIPVIGETQNWASMGSRLASVAQSMGVTLVGNDLSAEINGFNGLQISIDSQSAAKDIATELVNFKTRFVILQMFAFRNRLVLCEAYKKQFVNAVYMVMGWLPFGWWSRTDTDCTPAQLTSMANYFISANMMFFRSDDTTTLSCSQSMTVAQWRTEWYSRQGKTEGDLSMTPEGYALALEATTSADAVCMYAQMLHKILVVDSSATLTDMAARTQSAYNTIQTVLAASDFEGVQGRVRFAAGSADPKGSIIVQQLHADSTPETIVDIGSYTDGVWNFFGVATLKFQFSGESFSAGPAGATSITAPLAPFTVCPTGKSVSFVDNSCADCNAAGGFVFSQDAGLCVCKAGYQPAAGSTCIECAVGKFSDVEGAVACTDCAKGKYQDGIGKTACIWCAAGKYSSTAGRILQQQPAVRTVWLTGIQPFTGNDWDAGVSMRIGGEIMLEEINKHTTVLNGYELKVAWQDGLCAKAHGTNLFLTNIFDKRYDLFAPGVAIADLDVDNSGRIETSDTAPLNRWADSTEISPDPVGLLGSGCSGTAINIVSIAYMARFPLVSNSATRPGLSDRTQFPNFYRTILPDTKFVPAWLAMAKMLGQTEVVTVIGGTENWASMGIVMGSEAIKAGVKLVGFDKTAEMANFYGLQLSSESKAGAADVAKELVLLKKRVVILLVFDRRARLIMCEAYKRKFRNAIYMPFGWLAWEWWTVQDNDCSAEEMTNAASYFISANAMSWRPDNNAALSCSNTMTKGQFEEEWYSRQGASKGDLSFRPEGYAPALEAATTADATCMWAMALHDVLINKNIPLDHLSARTNEAYDAIQASLAGVDFEGIQGRVRYEPGQADPLGKVILQQMVPGSRRLSGRSLGTPTLVDIASSLNGDLSFFGNQLEFHFPGESYLAGPAGATTITAAVQSFQSCSGDTSLDFADNMCKSCPTGMVYLSLFGSCACKAGFVNDATTGNCEECKQGKFTGSAGQVACESCSPGKYASGDAATECVFCGLGFYQSANASSACVSCDAGETTIQTGLSSEAGCDCEEGMYRPRGVNTACEPCLKGMDCPFGSDANNFNAYGGSGEDIPLLAAGFYSTADEPLSIYECITEEACPGGAPASCFDRREGLVCASCPADYSVNKATGACDICSGGLTALVVLTPVFVSIVIVLVYYIGNSPLSVNASITLTCSVAGGLIVTVFQVLAVFKQLSIPWPKSVLVTFDVASLFALDADAVSIECAFGSDATVLYLFRVLVPISFVVLVSILFWLSKVVGCMLPTSTRVPWSLDKVLNTIGQVLQMLFIAFAVIVVRPLECAPHPNGEASMFLFPQVLCWSSDHTPLVILAAFETLFFLAPYAALCVWANVRAPVIANQASTQAAPNGFLVRFRFLMYRFRPDTWWWGNIYLLRQTLLAYASSMPADDPHGQIIFTICILSIYMLFLSRYWPWKNHSLNMLDAGSTLMMLLVISTATAFLPESPSKDFYVVFS
jgi:ABC-type branched-subunit amino acid transport system substrate-binding protein